MTAEEIKTALETKGPGVFRRHGIDLAYLFGSASRGRFGPQSDIDIAVRYKQPPRIAVTSGD